MSVSKIHISKFTGSTAKNILTILECDSLSENNLGDFCLKFLDYLNSGLSNDYTMIWDNYSVGGDQIDYVYKVFSSVAKFAGRIRASSWEITFGYNFEPKYPKKAYRQPTDKMHRLILLNTLIANPSGHDDLIVCVEEILGPTIDDQNLEVIQNEFIIGLSQ